jgi:hypothetical protein
LHEEVSRIFAIVQKGRERAAAQPESQRDRVVRGDA